MIDLLVALGCQRRQYLDPLPARGGEVAVQDQGEVVAHLAFAAWRVLDADGAVPLA